MLQTRAQKQYQSHSEQELKHNYNIRIRSSLNAWSKFPADKTQAIKHCQATSYGTIIIDQNNKHKIQELRFCQCCELPIQQQMFSISIDTTPHCIWSEQQAYKLNNEENESPKYNENQSPSMDNKNDFDAKNGKEVQLKQAFMLDSGTSLYFTFIKMAIMYLLLKFMTVDLYGLYENYIFLDNQMQYIDPKLRSDLFFVRTSSFYWQFTPHSTTKFTEFLDFIWVLFSIVYFNFYRKFMFRIYQYSDQIQPDLYTILVENIPVILPEEQIIHEKELLARRQNFHYEQIIKNYFVRKVVERMLFSNQNEDEDDSSKKQEDLCKRILNEFSSIVENEVAVGLMSGKDKINIVSKVILCYDLQEVQKFQALRSQLMASYEGLSQEEREKDERIIAEINFLNKQEVDYGEWIHQNTNLSWHLTHFTGKAFVTFQYSHIKDFIWNDFLKQKHKVKKLHPKNKNKQNFITHKYGLIGKQFPNYQGQTNYSMFNHKLNIKQAEKPTEINWQNMNVFESDRRFKMAQSYGYLLLMLGSIFIIFLVISKAKLQLKSTLSQSQMPIISTVLTLSITAFMFIINFILSKIVLQLVSVERHQSKAQEQVSIIIKTVLSQFINTTILNLIIAVILQNQEDLIHQNGIINSITTTIVSYGIIGLFTNMITLDILQYFYHHHYTNHNEPRFQITVNKALQKPKFDFTGRYAYYILQFLTVSFYSSLSPIIVFALTIYFLIMYWMDKYLLFKLSSSTIAINFKMSRMIFKIFQCGLLLFVVGDWITDALIVGKNQTIIQYMSVGLSLLYILFTLLILDFKTEQLLFGNKNKIRPNYTYTFCNQNKIFTKTYWTYNPATMYTPEDGFEGYYRKYKDVRYYHAVDELVQKKAAQDNKNDLEPIFKNNNEIRLQKEVQQKYGYGEEIKNSYELIQVKNMKSIYNFASVSQLQTSNKDSNNLFIYNAFGKRCPYSHQLKPLQLKSNFHFTYCYTCSKSINTKDQLVYQCRLCSFDLCQRCIQNKSQDVIDRCIQLKNIVQCHLLHVCVMEYEQNIDVKFLPQCYICSQIVIADYSHFYHCLTCAYFYLCYVCGQNNGVQDMRKIIQERKVITVKELHPQGAMDIHSVDEKWTKRDKYCHICAERIKDKIKSNASYKNQAYLYACCLDCGYDICEDCLLEKSIKKRDLNEIMFKKKY